MIDIAQLREALAEIGADYNDTADPIVNAARELLTIREAGALIITPDEDEWVRIAINAAAEADTVGHPLTEEVLRALHVGIRAVLDALRDAMPPGEGA